MTATNRRREPSAGGDALLWGLLIGAAVFVFAAIWVAVHLGSAVDGVNPSLPANPLTLVLDLLEHKVVWPASATWILVVGVLLVAFVAIAAFVAISRALGRRSRVDGASKHMGRGRDLAHLQTKGATTTAQRLGVASWIGVFIGRTVRGSQPIYASVEDTVIMITGPRMGKTTSLVIPAIVDAPGAVITTSNKRDVLDATRDVRAKSGKIWAFDPQAVALEEPTWWWNPLSYVTDDVKAAKLAEHFASSSREAGARTDAFFDGMGLELLAGLLMAAALEDRPVTQVFTWVTRPTDDEPVEILQTHGYPRLADAVAGIVHAADKTRSSVYATAQQMASCLKNQRILAWVAPLGPGDRRPQFDPHEFVQSTDTLYSLSKEGTGTAGPLVTALTAATVEAAEEWATYQAGGRMAVPLVVVLDEAANVCRWRQLPDLYSHYGSRGIVPVTILQSYSQGVAVWGREGMGKLWSAANVKVYGGGVSETAFLGDLSQLIGDHDRSTTSVSVGRNSRSTSHQLKRERTLDVAELASLPRGRAVVFAAGAPATLVATVPWTSGPRAAEIGASVAAHQPTAEAFRRPQLRRGPVFPSSVGAPADSMNGDVDE